METTFDKIIRKTGRKPIECKCNLCKKQCATPCLGTPEDIKKLIDAGYKEKLSITDWYVGMIFKEINFPITMVQALQTNNGCVFLENGLCTLHSLNLKPTEGRLSHHSVDIANFSFKKSLGWNVAKEWNDPKNNELITWIFNQME